MNAKKKKLLALGVSAAVVAIAVAVAVCAFGVGRHGLGESGEPALFSENPASSETKPLPKITGAVVLSPTNFDSPEDEQRYKNGEWHYPGELRSKYSYTMIQPDGQLKYIAGELIAEVDVNMADEDIEHMAKRIGASYVSRKSRLSSLGYCLVTFVYPDDTNIPALAEELKGLLNVSSIQANYPFEGLDASRRGADPLQSSQEYLKASKFQDSWKVVTCDKKVSVAVLDSGVDADRDDLVDNLDLQTYRDFTIDGTAALAEAVDPCGHGTIVAGIVGGVAGNETGISGASCNAQILPLRVLDRDNHGDIDNVVRAIDYLLESGNIPDVINMSLGCEYPTSCLQEAVNVCSVTYGVVCVAAVGNGSSYGATSEADSLMYPAACDNVIGVAAVGAASERASFSRVNSSVDICAQGVRTFSTTNPSAVLSTGGLYGDSCASGELSGTSFAAPQVAAAAALLKAQNPTWTPMRIEEELERAATDLGAPGRDDLYGYGLLDAAKAVGYGGSSSGSSSPFTGADDAVITREQAAAHARLQGTRPEDVPAAIDVHHTLG